MNFDSITTAAVAEELSATIMDGRVQSVVEIDYLSIGMEIYANSSREYLYISAHPESARIHLVDGKLRRGATRPSPLGLQLKKRLVGSRISAISQPPFERILILDFISSEDEIQLIVEIMGKHSNIILIKEGVILEAIKRVSSKVNRYREILPKRLYIPPPPIKKMPPVQVTPAVLSSMLMGDPDESVWRLFTRNIAGVGPFFAKEVIFRSTGDWNAPAFDVSPDVLHRTLQDCWNPHLEGDYLCGVCEANTGGGYTAFAAYEIKHLEGWKACQTISEALQTYWGAPVGVDAYVPAKSSVRVELEAALKQVKRKLASLLRQERSADDIETLRKKGELLFAYAYQIEAGSGSFEAQYEPDEPALKIQLNPTMSATENAQDYFSRYEKAKRACAELPSIIRAVELELDYLSQLEFDLNEAESWPEIDVVREALEQGGYWRGKKRKTPKSGKPGVRRFVTPDGFVILVGKNAGQNHSLVTSKSKNDDLWLHARDIPGSHVIVQAGGRSIPDEVINIAAGLAAYYSANKTENLVSIDVTLRKFVRPIKGAGPGMVQYRKEKTLRVKPEKPAL